ncbi:MAG: ATP-grasp domain-containing protein [bacterium]|nr:ATP-grasp domain-containing protein [bacterium]
MNHYDSALPRCQVFSPDVSFEGLENYRGRALCLTDNGDIIQLPNTIKHCWSWISNHYERIGLIHTKNVIWDSAFERIRDFPWHDISVFIFTKEIHAVRPDERRLLAVNKANSKNRFIKMCQELGVSVPETACFDSIEDFRDPGLSFPLYFKGDVSVSGLAVTRCENQDDLIQVMKHLKPGDGFQLQKELHAHSFINLQYEVTDGVLKRTTATEQILDGTSHNGNVFPSGFEAWNVVDPVAESLCADGIKDIFAFDVAMTDNGPVALECNPRFNGSTYPTVIADKLSIPSWLATNIKLHTDSFEGLSLDGLEYNPNTKSGIIVYNWGCVLNQKLGVLVAGDCREEQEHILLAAQKAL